MILWYSGEWMASCLKNLLSEKCKEDMETKQLRFKSRLTYTQNYTNYNWINYWINQLYWIILIIIVLTEIQILTSRLFKTIAEGERSFCFLLKHLQFLKWQVLICGSYTKPRYFDDFAFHIWNKQQSFCCHLVRWSNSSLIQENLFRPPVFES